jgi:hypothetical protein
VNAPQTLAHLTDSQLIAMIDMANAGWTPEEMIQIYRLKESTARILLRGPRHLLKKKLRAVLKARKRCRS